MDLSKKIIDRLDRDTVQQFRDLRITNREEFLQAVESLYNLKITRRNPFKLHLELTNHCNLACKMCPRDKMIRPRGYMDTGLAKRIIADGAANGLYHLSLFMHGEPLLHRDILEISRFSKDPGGTGCQQGIPSVNITTNGLLLDKEKSDALLDIGIDTLVISLSAVNLKNYTELIGNERQYATAVTNTQYVGETKKRRGLNKPFIRINAISNPALVNDSDKEKFRAYWSQYVDDIILSDAGPYGYGNQYYQAPQQPNRVPCRQLWRHFVILWNGDISPCCVDINGEVKLGNIGDRSLSEVWDGDELNRLRCQHMVNRLHGQPMCTACVSDWDY